jgi:hypothetical protein
MRQLITLALITLFATAGLTEAATITITTTPEQDAALVSLRQKLNKDRPIKLTAAEYRDYIVSQWLDGLVSQAGEDTRTTVREAYQGAPQATQDQVKALLGL